MKGRRKCPELTFASFRRFAHAYRRFRDAQRGEILVYRTKYLRVRYRSFGFYLSRRAARVHRSQNWPGPRSAVRYEGRRTFGRL